MTEGEVSQMDEGGEGSEGRGERERGEQRGKDLQYGAAF